MAGRSNVRTYNDWGQGSSGSKDPARSEYNSMNGQVYENGTFGPRPGWRLEATTAGTGVHKETSTADNIVGLQWLEYTDGTEHLALVFTDTSDSDNYKFDTLAIADYTYSAGQALADTADTSGDGELYPNGWGYDRSLGSWNDSSIMTALGPHIFMATGSSIGTVAAITTADGDARNVTIYRDRAYYWGMAAAPGRVYYSDAGDYATVGTGSFFDVNADVTEWAGAPVGMWSVKNSLLIACKGDTWKVLTGASPELGSLKEMARSATPVYETSVVADDVVLFPSPVGEGLVAAAPGSVDTESFRYMAATAYPGSTTTRPIYPTRAVPGVSDSVTGDLFVPWAVGTVSGIPAVERVNGVFNISYVDQSAAAYAPKTRAFAGGRPNEMYMVQAFTLAQEFLVYVRNMTLNEPAVIGGGLSDEGSEFVVDLGEITAGSTKIIRPTKVVLDLDYWYDVAGTYYAPPTIEVDATVLGCYGAVAEDAIAQQTVTTSSWADSTTGARRRVAVSLPASQWGTAVRVRLTLDNVALRNVHVYYDEQEDIR